MSQATAKQPIEDAKIIREERIEFKPSQTSSNDATFLGKMKANAKDAKDKTIHATKEFVNSGTGQHIVHTAEFMLSFGLFVFALHLGARLGARAAQRTADVVLPLRPGDKT